MNQIATQVIQTLPSRNASTSPAMH